MNFQYFTPAWDERSSVFHEEQLQLDDLRMLYPQTNGLEFLQSLQGNILRQPLVVQPSYYQPNTYAHDLIPFKSFQPQAQQIQWYQPHFQFQPVIQQSPCVQSELSAHLMHNSLPQAAFIQHASSFVHLPEPNWSQSLDDQPFHFQSTPVPWNDFMNVAISNNFEQTLENSSQRPSRKLRSRRKDKLGHVSEEDKHNAEMVKPSSIEQKCITCKMKATMIQEAENDGVTEEELLKYFWDARAPKLSAESPFTPISEQHRETSLSPIP